MPPYVSLSQSVTPLTVYTHMVPFVKIRDVIAQLPNLDDLSLSGSLVIVDRNTSPGIETALRGRFGGQLQLHKECDDADVVNTALLEVPTGLRFAEMQVRGMHERLSPTVRLTGAFGKTPVKLSYAVTIHGKCILLGPRVPVRESLSLTPSPDADSQEVFDRFFDVFKFPNLLWFPGMSLERS